MLIGSLYFSGTKTRPQSLGVLKDRVNLNHQASVDANSIHRALHILNTGPDLSGNFTCSVSTLESEDEKTKGMLVLGKYFHNKTLRDNLGARGRQFQAKLNLVDVVKCLIVDYSGADQAKLRLGRICWEIYFKFKCVSAH